MAFARLRLTAPTPGVGPDPSLNDWNMAAVGYPLWLWAEGATDPPPVTDSVGGLSVSLHAHVSKVVFDMGDGTKLTCRGSGQRWTDRVSTRAIFSIFKATAHFVPMSTPVTQY